MPLLRLRPLQTALRPSAKISQWVPTCILDST